MQKRVIIIHQWCGSPKTDFYPWLKKELEKRNFKVLVPAMPDTNHPKIKPWVTKLKNTIVKPDKNTYLIGHSVGCQTILRYLESLSESTKIGGAIFVAGWFNLTKEVTDDKGQYKIAKPWLKTKINFNKILKHTKKFVALFSSNDPYVPSADSKIFKNKIKAKIIIQKNKGHFTQDDKIKKVPVIIKELIRISS